MHITGRTSLIYTVLVAVWGLVVGWQVIEHNRVKEAARSSLINRSRAIATTQAGFIRSQRWGAIVFKDRVEPALKELVKSGEVISVALLNASGGEVLAAGPPMDPEVRNMLPTGERWGPKSVTVVNPVYLDEDASAATILVSRPPREPPGGTRPPRRPPGPGDTNGVVSGQSSTNSDARPGPSRDGEGRPRFQARPPRMSDEEYKALLEKQGLHGFAMVMPTDAFQAKCREDLWFRFVIASFGGISVAGFGFAWRTFVRSSELQLRLLRASEMNAHLREMNVAAAGLAHETRNPLNIIRGLAHMVSRQSNVSPEIRAKSVEITDEVDRVTAQLNEFINYSKPREVRRAPVTLNTVIGEVVRALKSDLEDKVIRLTVSDENLAVQADEQFLRQVLFNLLLNAVQAVEANGEIQFVTKRSGPAEACLEIRDNGPGVALEQRKEIFKPYFTTHQKGTGLGLAVVQQIVLAHGWEIECLPNEPRGAVFRISRLQVTTKA